ncbi:hypothetical protein [Brevundimonas sp.]|uniref:hypothetical protein n=1 Tax=Brevundimonas sp. TaxID=1871086 RepID=UPI0019CCE9CD|nr:MULTISPECIES: hypothetical protein [Alphaproteobacteria]MBD3804889.1 hypothetical protein [Thioclava sp.]MBD3838021.1 hypothetical protein [Brevundimonas sp.]
MSDLAAARRAIDEHILGVMFAGYIPDYGICETYFGFRCFVTPELPREVVRGVLRDLTDQGLCRYRAGLFKDCGETAGAGYGLTSKGIEAYLALSGKERPKSIADWWAEQKEVQKNGDFSS